MEKRNETTVTQFVLLGFSDHVEHQLFLFILFLVIYTGTIVGNIIIITLIKCSSHLHNPMYFFLINLSVLDIGFISVTIPKLLISILSQINTISFYGCITQLFFFITFAGVECFILTVMAYDRYVAICNPLRYAAVMSRSLCLQLVVICWVSALSHSVLHSILTTRLSFCGPNIIHHFFCDMTALLKLACSDITTNEIVIFAEGPFSVMVPFLLVTVSYIHIISSILKIHSKDGRKKAFSTCSSHLTVVALFYGTAIFTYFRPSSEYSDYDRVVSLFYTIVAPMLNPFIYSLRNNELKKSLKNLISRKIELIRDYGNYNANFVIYLTHCHCSI
ncbi:olfactory receptor 1-like [Rhinatrema bivittatum]|uniref:olfactory receptor 1-like n=1 Tax=Rhinatrema bivittatum TaxID=194408 RepID=UPI001127B33B|nr:olfactory receptor 1-like [Rhinatrema bivittatum]